MGYAAGRAFGEKAGRLGGNVRDIDGDITRLWFDDLRPRWRREPVAVAGLSTYSSLLSLKLMAMDVGIRPVYRGYHHLEGGLRHELFGPESLLPGSDALGMRGDAWARDIARLVMTWPDATAQSGPSTLAEADLHLLSPSSLTSWILAPRART
jgi:hypothetical protein